MSFLSSLSKLLDDDLLDDLREVGKELGALKDEVVGDVVASVKEVSGDVQDLAKTAKENTNEITKVISDFKRPNGTK